MQVSLPGRGGVGVGGAKHQPANVFSSLATNHEKTEPPQTHLLSVELPEALPQLHEGGLNASVVGQRQQ